MTEYKITFTIGDTTRGQLNSLEILGRREVKNGKFEPESHGFLVHTNDIDTANAWRLLAAIYKFGIDINIDPPLVVSELH
jgi:hypothetical protein